MALPDPTVTLYAVGDVGPNRRDPDSIFRHVAGVLHQGDIAFCQLEPALSRRGNPLPQARLAMRADPDGARALKEAGFQVVSFASNHCLDYGQDAFFDTLQALKEQDLAVIGVGRNLAEARQPAIIERKGTRVAFLGYNTILPQGYWAEEDRPGCAPLRAHTVYEPIEPDQPGTPCRIHTFAHRGDLQAMEEDVRRARERAEVVVVSLHGGIHFVPAIVPEYQREMARAAVEVGADLVVGHHAHILKGIEVYRGKVIFYGLGNFALESPHAFADGLSKSQSHLELTSLYSTGKKEPDSLMQADSIKTILVKCLISGGRISRVSFQPAFINEQSEPEILDGTDPRCEQVVEYMKEITRGQGLDAVYSVQEEEVAILQEEER